MRIKSLAVIVSSFILTVTIASCLGDNDTIEYSSDDTVHAFQLDDIYGVNYKFSIDQINRRIFNQDSVPVSADTIINRILIKTLTTVSGYVTTGDTLLVMSDSIDFTKSMTDPMKIKVYSADGGSTREYSIEVRRHLQDPDSLHWTKRANSFAGAPVNNQKIAVMGDNLVIFTSNTTAYTSPLSDGQNWQEAAVSNLPANIKLNSLTFCKDRLYIVTEDGKVFNTTNAAGTQWTESASLSGNIITLVAAFPENLVGIVNDNGTPKFCVTNTDMTSWQTGEEVHSDFPLENLSSTVFPKRTNPNLYQAILAGRSTGDITMPWFSDSGLSWTPLDDGSTTKKLPGMNRPTVMHYNDQLYGFSEQLDSLYNSQEGITWNKIKQKVVFPEDMPKNTNYSMTMDKDNFIWLVQNNGMVWRGRINRLGFKIK